MEWPILIRQPHVVVHPLTSTHQHLMVQTDEYDRITSDIFHLARVALAGRQRDVAVLVRKYARRYRSSVPELADKLTVLLRENPRTADPTRRIEPEGLPVDGDSRLPLVRMIEAPVLEVEPVYDSHVWAALQQVAREHQLRARLAEAGVDPTRSVLFTGPPGVGKTFAAKWMARELGQPLAILDLSAVMSSFLGRTGSNVRAVLDFARDRDCILLLDELDAVAKRRDDTSEIGELKRLVTVLLQEIDEWPPSCLLLAATNHARLLDSAVWRRFEVVVEFPLPQSKAVTAVLRAHLELHATSPWPGLLGRVLAGSSFSAAVQAANHARRMAVVDGSNIERALERVLHDTVRSLDRKRRQKIAVSLVDEGVVSQRQANAITGVSRDTIRKYATPGKRGSS